MTPQHTHPTPKSSLHKCAIFLDAKIVSECDQENHNHNLQTTSWHREEEPHDIHETPGRQAKQNNQLSLPHRDDCKLEWTQSKAQQSREQSQNPTMGVAINKESTPTEPPP